MNLSGKACLPCCGACFGRQDHHVNLIVCGFVSREMAVISTDYQENRTQKHLLRIIFRPYRAQHKNGLSTQGLKLRFHTLGYYVTPLQG
jgi:hypothetical protein